MSMAATPDLSVAASGLQTFLAFDYGQKRTGVAIGSRLLKTATAVRSIEAGAAQRLDHAAQRQHLAVVDDDGDRPDGAGMGWRRGPWRSRGRVRGR